MKKEAKISVIIPVYNGEKWIERCVKSVFNQTYSNIEIILSNDGSKDRSLEIIKGLAKKHKNIKYDSHENVGLSITRNIALKLATGEFVTYLDVDDCLDKDFISNLFDEKYDIMIGGYKSVFENGKVNFVYSFKKNSEWNAYKRVTVWGKIYRTSFLRDNNISYPDIRLYGEDVVYTMRCLSAFPKTLVKTFSNYNATINSESIIHTQKDKIITDVPKMINQIDLFIESKKAFLEKKEKFISYYYLKIVCFYIFELAAFLNFKELVEYYEKNMSSVINIFKKYNYRLHFICQKDEPFKVNFIINMFTIFYRIKAYKLLIWIISKCFHRKEK